MQYETPNLKPVTPAIHAIQSLSGSGHKSAATRCESHARCNEVMQGYADWED